MFIESSAKRILKLHRSEALGRAEGALRSSAARRILSESRNYKHSAVLRLMFSVALAIALSTLQISPRPAGAHSSSFRQALSQDQDDDVVRVNTDLVVLNATVLDKDGKFIPGLKRTDFQIFEDGAQQRVANFTAEETPFAAAILLDTSGSMESRLSLGRSAAIRFLDGLRQEDVAAVYNFDSKVEQMQDFSPGRDLPARAFGLRTKMMTALNDAVLRAANEEGDKNRDDRERYKN